MEPTERKEQLRKKFEDFLKPAPAQFHSLHRSDVFDFFYSEIESRDRLLEAAEELLKAHEEIIKAIADAVKESKSTILKKHEYIIDGLSDIVCEKHGKYNQLKQQSKT